MCKWRMLIVIILSVLLIVVAAIEVKAEGVILYAAHSEGELNVRESPYGERVGYLLPGDRVEFVEQAGGWVFVKVGIESGGGWVKATYLTVDLTAAGIYRNDSGGRVRIRQEPNGETSGWLAVGKEIKVHSVLPDESGELWGRTSKGYIKLDYLIKQN